MARDAITPFFDRSLERRVDAARQEWLAQAQAPIDEQDGGDLDQLRADAVERSKPSRTRFRRSWTTSASTRISSTCPSR